MVKQKKYDLPMGSRIFYYSYLDVSFQYNGYRNISPMPPFNNREKQ